MGWQRQGMFDRAFPIVVPDRELLVIADMVDCVPCFRPVRQFAWIVEGSGRYAEPDFEVPGWM